MNKKIFYVSLCLCLSVGLVANAQFFNDDDFHVEINDAAHTNKRGVYLLPEAGDFALGVNAMPFLRYAGNIFTSGVNYPPFFSGVEDATIFAKYFLADERAIRVRLSLGMENIVNNSPVTDQREYLKPITDDTRDISKEVIDTEKISSFGFELGIGYEFRRGKGRVQGFYGGEIILGLIPENKFTYEYGNKIIEDDKAPLTTTNFYNFSSGNRSIRTTELNPGSIFSFGLGGFAGVEYFFAPQMSIGGEFGLGFRFSSKGEGSSTFEFWDTDIEVDRRVTKTETDLRNYNAKSINFGTGSYSRIFLMFHF